MDDTQYYASTPTPPTSSYPGRPSQDSSFSDIDTTTHLAPHRQDSYPHHFLSSQQPDDLLRTFNSYCDLLASNRGLDGLQVYNLKEVAKVCKYFHCRSNSAPFISYYPIACCRSTAITCARQIASLSASFGPSAPKYGQTDTARVR